MEWWNILITAIGIFMVCQVFPGILKSVIFIALGKESGTLTRFAIGCTLIFLGVVV